MRMTGGAKMGAKVLEGYQIYAAESASRFPKHHKMVGGCIARGTRRLSEPHGWVNVF